MATTTFSSALLPLPEVVPVKSVASGTKSFLTRAMAALVASRERAAQREIARYRALIAEPVATLKVDAAELPFDHA